MPLLNQAVLLLLVALAGRCAEARAVVREDVKGVAALLQDEARDDPFFDHNPQYDFAYRIHDEETGDAKDQTEERRGDAVQGSYSVVDPDGTLRVVRYTADDANGFNAVVSLTPGHAKPFVPKPTLQRRVAVVQNHVDVPVPVQHHVLPSTSQQILGDQRVLVEHPKHQASAQVQPLVQQHLIQPPLAFGLHQDVHHLIPRGPTYQLHHIHQLSPSGVGTHHQMTVPIVQIQDQGNMDAQQQHMAFLQVQQEQFKKQQEQVQAMIQAQQQGQLFLAPQPQKQAMNSAQQMEQQREGLQDAQPVQQQQQQQQQQQDQQSSILQDQQGSVIQQQTSISQEQGSVVQQDGVSQQQDIDSQQQENVIQQQDESSSGFSLPQVIDVRHSVVQKPEQGQALSPQSQVRSLDGGVLQSGRVSPHQRTLAVYRTSSGVQGGGNFITFSSPYAQYTVS